MTRRRTMIEAVQDERGRRIGAESAVFSKRLEECKDAIDRAKKQIEKRAIAALAKIGVFTNEVTLTIDAKKPGPCERYTRSFVVLRDSIPAIKDADAADKKARTAHAKVVEAINKEATEMIRALDLCDKITPELTAKVRAYCGVKG